jgi:hypothetical protein
MMNKKKNRVAQKRKPKNADAEKIERAAFVIAKTARCGVVYSTYNDLCKEFGLRYDQIKSILDRCGLVAERTPQARAIETERRKQIRRKEEQAAFEERCKTYKWSGRIEAAYIKMKNNVNRQRYDGLETVLPVRVERKIGGRRYA